MRAGRRRPVSLGGKGGGASEPGTVGVTPERLAHAARQGGALIDAHGVRRVADAFDLLRQRQRLDRENPSRNDLMWQAGDRFRRHWYLSGLDGLKAFDFSRDSVDGGGGAGSTTPTEAAMRHRETHRRAAEAVGARLLPYLCAIAVESKAVADLRPLVTDTAHPRTADALIIERLREGLHRLCDHWGMHAGGKSRPIRRWRDEAPDRALSA